MEEQNQNQNISQSLEDQSIFTLLGVMNATDSEREDFLDRLQKTIWDDFLDNDVNLLLTEDEMKPVWETLNDPVLADEAKQEKLVVYLEKLIPDLEDILMEKALKLKEDLVRERVSSLEQVVADRPDKMNEIGEIRRLMEEGKWQVVGEKLNRFVI